MHDCPKLDHQRHIDKARYALIDDEPRLEELSASLPEALGHLLRMAREIQVDQKSIKDAQVKMKETLDEVGAEQVAKGMKPQCLPKTLEVAGAIVTNPVMLEVAKKLIGG